MKCLDHIETTEHVKSQGDIKKNVMVEIPSLVPGYSKEKIGQFGLDNMSNEKIQNLAKKGLLRNITGNGTRQKIVSEKGIEHYMNQGDEVFTTLQSGRIVMKLPSTNYLDE
jgi:hypothetical protein